MNIACYLEHTNLSPVATISDIDRMVDEAKQFGFIGVCVPPFWVRRAWRERGNEKFFLVTVAGFPLGYNMTETKLDEIKRAIDNGADEIDLVWNVSSFKTGIPWTKIEVAKAARLAHDHERVLKVIIETSYLSHEEIIAACKICSDAGADFVKTSTGFGGGGATVEHVQLIRQHLPCSVGVKASGGIKTYKQAMDLITAGADRIGTSSAIAIVSSQPTP